jgi:hypothetical protein
MLHRKSLRIETIEAFKFILTKYKTAFLLELSRTKLECLNLASLVFDSKIRTNQLKPVKIIDTLAK